MRRHAMLKPGGIDDYRLCTSIKNIFKIFYFGPKSTPTQPLSNWNSFLFSPLFTKSDSAININVNYGFNLIHV